MAAFPPGFIDGAVEAGKEAADREREKAMAAPFKRIPMSELIKQTKEQLKALTKTDWELTIRGEPAGEDTIFTARASTKVPDVGGRFTCTMTDVTPEWACQQVRWSVGAQFLKALTAHLSREVQNG